MAFESSLLISGGDSKVKIMKKIPLSGKNGVGKFALVDDEDYESINKHGWFMSGRGILSQYAVRGEWKKINGVAKNQRIYIHRVVMGLGNAREDKVFVDHKDGNTLDNRKENLRLCTRAENTRNLNRLRTNNKSGFRGVHFDKKINKWRVLITYNRKKYYFGSFIEKMDAVKRHEIEAKRMFGEFYSAIR